MRILIVEDETIASEYLAGLIRQIEPQCEIAGITESIAQTVKWLGQNAAPDLILMDIHLSDGSAFSIFEVAEVEVPIIFTTAYDEYAIDAFKVNSIDYLLKPVDEQDLRKALAKFYKLSELRKREYVAQQSKTGYVKGYIKKLLISHKDNLLPVDVSQIVYFYTSDHRTSIGMSDGKRYPYNKTLDALVRQLDPEDFFRANKQFVISKNYLANITVWFDRRLLVSLSTETPERIYVSKNKSAEFKEWVTGAEL